MKRKTTQKQIITLKPNNRLETEFNNKELLLHIRIENLAPLSLNSMYPTSRSGHRFMSDEGKEYELRIGKALGNHVIENKIDYYQNFDFHCSLDLGFGFSQLYYSNGTVKRNDISNYTKAIEDAIANFFGYNDTYNFECRQRKYYSEVPHIDIKLYKLLQETV